MKRPAQCFEITEADSRFDPLNQLLRAGIKCCLYHVRRSIVSFETGVNPPSFMRNVWEFRPANYWPNSIRSSVLGRMHAQTIPLVLVGSKLALVATGKREGRGEMAPAEKDVA